MVVGKKGVVTKVVHRLGDCSYSSQSIKNYNAIRTALLGATNLVPLIVNSHFTTDTEIREVCAHGPLLVRHTY